MKKIISAKQNRLADQYTIENDGIKSIDLMERASEAFVDKLLSLIKVEDQIVKVFAGPGNNGGDGFAIARLLKNRGFSVLVYFLKFTENLSEDCSINLERFGTEGVHILTSDTELLMEEDDIVIDAIFGSGLNKPIEGWVSEITDQINAKGETVFSVDIPSGIYADKVDPTANSIKNSSVISFQRPKLSFFLPETAHAIKEWHVVDIGLNESFIQQQQSCYYFLESAVAASILPSRNKFQHKGDFGRVQVFSGSFGKMGAAFLCGKAVLKIGAGLLTMHVPKLGYELMQTSLPEAMATVDINDKTITNGFIEAKTNAVCIGPGIGVEKETSDWLKTILSDCKIPILLDADALNILSMITDGLSLVPKGAVLTPHVGEFDRLFGNHQNTLGRIETIKQKAKELDVVIVLKGAHSIIGLPNGKIVFNTTGNSGMATAGSGDTLSGIITGLMAQKLSNSDAAILGVYLHGMAGDIAEKKVGKMSLMASDLLSTLPKAIYNVGNHAFI